MKTCLKILLIPTASIGAAQTRGRGGGVDRCASLASDSQEDLGSCSKVCVASRRMSLNMGDEDSALRATVSIFTCAARFRY